MKATEQYFPVVLFITLYKVVLTFESVTIQMQAIEHYYLKVLFGSHILIKCNSLLFMDFDFVCPPPVKESDSKLASSPSMSVIK